ncbi:Nramp family divalent metal transporter [Saccharopolyspora sp. K220]|uniref:Nramp family divalent metal transporter n=1 Tax=Saccharopolyspora soli TaxID=2926618 RepID=UPI001F55C02C|nr:Nramp family divalent metal transporter [Saccharopolyspora soli]MCI2417337.1 Nramp family divalent metal transporter [Saccharopolyspora soli]
MTSGQQESRPQAPPAVTAPRTFGGYLRNIGPGLVVSMSWLGAGDLVSSSVSGGNYGYALMWALVLALFSRLFFTLAIARYGLCNSVGDQSIISGFGRLWRHLPVLVGVLSFIAGFILQTYMAVAVGTALYHLSGGFGGQTWGVFDWTVVTVAVTALMLWRNNRYTWLEIIARATVAVLVISFVTAAVLARPDLGALAAGLAFDLPADQGVFSTVLVAAAIIGAVGGSAGNLMYPEFTREKGWHGPAFLPLQRVDLLAGVLAVIVVNLSVWVVGAEIVRPYGLQVDGIDDLAEMMRLAVGPAGPWIFWLGLFFVAFSSFPSYATGYTKILFSGLYESLPKRRERYRDGARDPLFNVLQIGVMVVLPLAFALPGLPDVLVLTIVGSSITGILAPIILIGTIALTASKRFMIPAYANRWWMNVILCAVGVIGLWAAYGTIAGLIDLAR